MIIEAMVYLMLEAGQVVRAAADALIGNDWLSVVDANGGALLTAGINFLRAFVPDPALAALFSVVSAGLALAIVSYALRAAKAVASWTGLGSS